MSLKIIVAMARNRVIGNDNQMPWHLPEDLAYFKRLTWGNVVIMGRKTFTSIGKALPGRTNVVLTRDPGFQPENVEAYSSLEEAVQRYPDAFVIGGASVFEQALPNVDTMYITRIDAEIAGDTVFPDFNPQNWDISIVDKLLSISGHELSFCRYTRKPIKQNL